MPKTLDITSWRKSTPKEVTHFYKSKGAGKKPSDTGYLVVRSHLRPVDVYSYLRARFGVPNGLQNFLRRDDSDNLIHWDFNLKAEGIDIYISGTSRDIHFMIAENLTDQEWKSLIIGLKIDFGRMGRTKSDMMRSFEKFVVFQNKYVTLAELCAEMHDSITGAPAAQTKPPEITTKRSLKRYESSINKLSKRATNLHGDCLKLQLLTPIMAEAFINMVILIFCKDEVRNDMERYEAFVRSKLPERLTALNECCDGLIGPINQTTTVYRDFKRVMDKRNFSAHGNIDPVREQIETVYFEGKRPIFTDGGDPILKFFERLETIYSPQEVIADYEVVHLFLIEIADHLTHSHRVFFDQVIDDPYPGYELNKQRVTKILPNHNIRAALPDIRYDDELNVSW